MEDLCSSSLAVLSNIRVYIWFIGRPGSITRTHSSSSSSSSSSSKSTSYSKTPTRKEKKSRTDTMYHWSTSSPSPYYSSSNGKTLVSSQQDDDLLSSPSMSSYGLLQEQQCYYPQQPSIRRVQSTGDLVAPALVPAAAARYSAEERRERIEKYRSKRNQRNFQKKITYACRKTLADSRPRVKGRFARNDDTAELPESFTDAAAAEVSSSLMSEGNVVDAVATDASSSMPEWWPAMQGALAMEDEELLASYIGVSTINLY